jgi:DNA polymerase II
VIVVSKQPLPLSAFLLTRQWKESDTGLELIFWFASSEGPLRLHLPRQEAICFFPSSQTDEVKKILNGQKNWRINPTELLDFTRQKVSALYFSSQRQLFDNRDRLAIRDIRLLESDIKPTDRFLMERFIKGAVEVQAEQQDKEFYKNLVNVRLKATDYRPTLSAVSIDIETDYDVSQLYSIALYSDDIAKVLMIGEGEVKSRAIQSCQKCSIDLQFYANEKNLIKAFLQIIAELNPDVLIGWNVVNFDLKCLQDFADRAGVKLTLGRNNEPINWRQSRDSDQRFYALVPGRVILDGIELMRSATYQFENFSLEYVSRRLLKRGKLVEDVEQRSEEISKLFLKNKSALASYNLEDCRLVWDIFEKENLLSFAIERSQLTGLELGRYGGSVAAIDFLYLPRLHRAGFVAPALDQLEPSSMSPGGHVMRSMPGIHDNVIVLDFKSLYPSIIRSFHVDPLALIEGLIEDNAIEGYDGGLFSRDKYILPELIEDLWAARDRAKANSDEVLSQAIKIIMNSFYGVLGTIGCRFFDSRLVSSITKRGHEIIIQSKEYIEDKGYQVIYGDTDSVFVLLGNVKKDKIASIGGCIARDLNNWWNEKLEKEYSVTSFLEIQFETHYQKFLIPTIRGSDAGSKKRYAGLLADNKVQFKGLETVRSDWSPLAREFQKVLYKKVFLDEPFDDYVKNIVEKLLNGEFEDELVLRKRLRRKLDDYVKNVPPHVQAARKAEVIRDEKKLPSLYKSGGWIEYLMTTNGPEPRQYRRASIDFDFYIDKQLIPIADAILIFKSTSMNDIINQQIGLF